MKKHRGYILNEKFKPRRFINHLSPNRNFLGFKNASKIKLAKYANFFNEQILLVLKGETDGRSGGEIEAEGDSQWKTYCWELLKIINLRFYKTFFEEQIPYVHESEAILGGQRFFSF